MRTPTHRRYRTGEPIELPQGVRPDQLDDPQRALEDGRTRTAGFHTVFANVKQDDCEWALPISFTTEPSAPPFTVVPALSADVTGDQVDLSGVLKHNVTEIFTRAYAQPRSPYCSLAIADNLLGGWANPDGRAAIEDVGLRGANGMLTTPLGVTFATASGNAPNCLFLSHWAQDQKQVRIPLKGRARGIYLLMTGTTLPQCSRIQHGTVSVSYNDNSTSRLSLRNPETWWPIEQDYLLDDYLFVNDAPLPPRVDLRTGRTRLLDRAAFKGKGRAVPGGAASILHLALDPAKELASLRVDVELYGIIVGLLAATLARP